MTKNTKRIEVSFDLCLRCYEPAKESVFAEWRETANRSSRFPFVYERKAIKASLPLAGGRKVAVRFIAARHLPRYRSARGVARHRDIFSDPTMPKAGERESRRADYIVAHRVSLRSVTSGSSLHCRHPDNNDAAACTHDAEGLRG